VGKEYVIPLYMCWDLGQKLTRDWGRNYPIYLKRGGEQIVKKIYCFVVFVCYYFQGTRVFCRFKM